VIRLFRRREKDRPDDRGQTPEELTRWRKALNRTKANLANAWQFAVVGEVEVSAEFFDALTDALILADLGVPLAEQVVNDLRSAAKDRGLSRVPDVRRLLAEMLAGMLTFPDEPQLLREDRLNVVIFAGVNGTGKTTALAKVAHLLKAQGVEPVAAAADTFRAAAVEQLSIWGQRVGFAVVTGASNADPASVVYNAVEHALTQEKSAVLVDTAGRLQTKRNLMEELSKIGRAARKVLANRGIDADERLHEVNFLVLDATTGQNAISQAQLFREALPLSGLILNKIDGTAKGGVVFPVVQAAQVPVLYLGVGEQPADLLEFDPRRFASQLLELDSL
jgi:fused signal recognition particle receptor